MRHQVAKAAKPRNASEETSGIRIGLYQNLNNIFPEKCQSEDMFGCIHRLFNVNVNLNVIAKSFRTTCQKTCGMSENILKIIFNMSNESNGGSLYF